MAVFTFYVLRSAGIWRVRLNGRDAFFATPRAAFSAAVDAAYKAGKRGDAARVLVENGDRWREAWTYGKDPYPPIRPP